MAAKHPLMPKDVFALHRVSCPHFVVGRFMRSGMTGQMEWRPQAKSTAPVGSVCGKVLNASAAWVLQPTRTDCLMD